MNATTATSAPEFILHDTQGRLRLRCPDAVPLPDLRVQLELLPGVHSVRLTPSIRSATVSYDGRRPTRTAIVRLVDRMARHPRPSASPAVPSPRRRRKLGTLVPALVTAAVPLAPSQARPAVALGALAVRAAARRPQERRTTSFLLDTLSLATTALSGNPVATATSILLGSVAEAWRDGLLEDADRLLEHLCPPVEPDYSAERAGSIQRIGINELRIADVVSLEAGQVVPTDGLVRTGEARIFPLTHHEDPAGRRVRSGQRLASGERLATGSVAYVVERTAARSQARRMREHIRHTLHTKDGQSRITPELDRLTALPVTAAGLVLAITRDASRTAAMLQADPPQGLLLSHPVASEAALYALARQGMLGNGLETVERLATATTLAIEDTGILTARDWHLDEIRPLARQLIRSDVVRWLARLAGVETVDAQSAGFSDRQVAEWLEHGAVLSDPPRILHVAGAEPMRRTWGIELQQADRGSLERVLGIVEAGQLLGSVKLRVRLRPAVAEQLGELRQLGFRRIAILTEDLEERPGPELETLGADVIVSTSREAQGRWLEQAVEHGERVALLHTGLRDLLPPGGLSLCPAESEAGAHGVLLGDPLRSLIAARVVATTLFGKLRRQFGATMAANAALMVVSGLRLIPPIATTTLHHTATLLLLRSSMGLASVGAFGMTGPSAKE